MSGEVAGELTRLHHGHFGRGPASTRAYIGEDVLVCVLNDVYTLAERTLIELGKTELVRETRLIYQRAVQDQYIEIVQRVTGRTVTAVASTVTFDPDQAIEFFSLRLHAATTSPSP